MDIRLDPGSRPAPLREAVPDYRPPGRLGRLLLTATIVLVVLAAIGGAGVWAVRNGWVSMPVEVGAIFSRPAPQVAAANQVMVFSGQPSAILAGNGNSVEPAAAGEWAVVRSGLRTASSATPPDGAVVAIPADLGGRLAGKQVRFIITARAAKERPAGQFAVAFSAPAIRSGWIVFSPAAEFRTYAVTVRLPPKAAADKSSLAIWGDITGAGGGVEIRSITARIQP